MKYSILILLGIILYSCKEEVVVSEISARVYENCDQVASQVEIALKANSSFGSFNEPTILASAITDGNGYVRLSYELDESKSGRADLIKINSNGYQTLISNLDLKKDFDLDLYATNTTTLYLSLNSNRVLTLQDTLFVQFSYGPIEKFYVQPANGVIDTFKIDVPNLLNASTFTWLNYGIGIAQFNLSKEALTIEDSLYQNIGLLLEGCPKDGQVEIAIQ
tara:strand:+ start:702 stop:1361 length:660 start_codon:yes stop_codon:yes gene_type:complete